MKRFTRTLLSLAGGATLLLATDVTPSHAQHGGDMALASTADGGGALTIEFDFGTVVPVSFLTEVSGTSVYTATDPGFDSLAADEPLESLFVLDTGVELRVEITALDAGKTAMNLNGTLLDTIGESVVLGTTGALPPNDPHHHPELQLLLMMAPGEFGEGTISFKLTTTSPLYTESASYTLKLSNGHLAPIAYDASSFDKDSVGCQKAVGKAIKGFLAGKYQAMAKCLDVFQTVEALEAAGLDATSAEAKADAACGQKLLDAVAKVRDKATASIAGKCGPLGSNDMNAESIAAHVSFVGCRVEETISASYPGAQGLLAEITVGGNPVDQSFPCLTPAAGHAHE